MTRMSAESESTRSSPLFLVEKRTLIVLLQSTLCVFLFCSFFEKNWGEKKGKLLKSLLQRVLQVLARTLRQTTRDVTRSRNSSAR